MCSGHFCEMTTQSWCRVRMLVLRLVCRKIDGFVPTGTFSVTSLLTTSRQSSVMQDMRPPFNVGGGQCRPNPTSYTVD